jgi:hypothetical protein
MARVRRRCCEHAAGVAAVDCSAGRWSTCQAGACITESVIHRRLVRLRTHAHCSAVANTCSTRMRTAQLLELNRTLPLLVTSLLHRLCVSNCRSTQSALLSAVGAPSAPRAGLARAAGPRASSPPSSAAPRPPRAPPRAPPPAPHRPGPRAPRAPRCPALMFHESCMQAFMTPCSLAWRSAGLCCTGLRGRGVDAASGQSRGCAWWQRWGLLAAHLRSLAQLWKCDALHKACNRVEQRACRYA